jgi:hypothetical protein
MYDLLDSVRVALTRTDPNYCRLSEIDYSQETTRWEHAAKFQERAIAYEFYHQLRSLMERGECGWSALLQAEISKDYQHLFKEGVAPDFLIHIPSSIGHELAVIEVKLATRPSGELEADLDKLVSFRNSRLTYQYLIQVIAGPAADVARKRTWLEGRSVSEGDLVSIFTYDSTLGGVDYLEIRYAAGPSADIL